MAHSRPTRLPATPKTTVPPPPLAMHTPAHTAVRTGWFVLRGFPFLEVEVLGLEFVGAKFVEPPQESFDLDPRASHRWTARLGFSRAASLALLV